MSPRPSLSPWTELPISLSSGERTGVRAVESQYIVGIDLGTTNCAVAFVPVIGQDSPPEDFLIPQLQRPGEVASRKLLPSSLYVPGEHELPPGSTQLPWGESAKLVVGEFARMQAS